MKTLCRCLIEGQKYGRWKPTETSVLRSFTKAWFHCLRTSIPGVLGLTFRAFFLILTRGLEHVVCLGESRLSQVNNSPRANVFPAGVANFGKAMYRSLERSIQDTRDGFFLYSAQASFSWPRVDLARLLRRAYSRPFWITSFEFVKVCGIRFSIWESFIGFYICCYPITTILKCLFSVGVRISWKTLCWMRAWRRRWHLLSPTLYIIIVYRVNLNKLSRNFVGAIRTTTTNCRVSFIDLYLVFPTNFRIVFYAIQTL